MSLSSAENGTHVQDSDCLAVLREAIGCRHELAAAGPFDGSRVIAAADARSPDEGLALLGAYVSIADRRVRQAILDTLRMIAAADTTDGTLA